MTPTLLNLGKPLAALLLAGALSFSTAVAASSHKHHSGDGDRVSQSGKKNSRTDAGCLPEVNAKFSADGLTVTASSSKDLSNVVILYDDGTVEKYDGLSGYQLSFTGVGDYAGKTVNGVWIKSGCNLSGDGPGYGEFIANDDNLAFLPTVSINDNYWILEDEYQDVEALFIISLSEPAPEGAPVRVSYITFDGSAIAIEDYIHETGSVEFLPGEITKTISITVVGDEFREEPELFYVDIFDAYSAIISKERATGRIEDIEDDR